MIILIILTCSAAFFCGWLVGPAVLPFAKRFKEWDQKNLERSKARAKEYSIPGVWFTHPDLWDHRGEIFVGIAILIAVVLCML